MARIIGGIQGTALGTVGNITYSSARDLKGKVNTARIYTVPANPKTALQLEQRSKFSQAVFIVKSLGISIYKTDWNRMTGELPGWQSGLNIFINSIDAQNRLQIISEKQLGTLPDVSPFEFVDGGGGEFDMSWNNATPIGSTANDTLVLIAIEQNKPVTGVAREIHIWDTEKRENGSQTFSMSPSKTYLMLVYVRGAGVEAGRLSLMLSSLFVLGA